jgi:hypothetical protein
MARRIADDLADDWEVNPQPGIRLAKVWPLGSIAFSEALNFQQLKILPARPNRNMAEGTSRLPKTASVTERAGGNP